MKLSYEVQTPERDVRREQWGKVGVVGEEIVRGEVQPVARGRVAGRHREFLEGLVGRLKGCGVITVGCADIVGAKDGNKKMKFALVCERIDGGAD